MGKLWLDGQTGGFAHLNIVIVCYTHPCRILMDGFNGSAGSIRVGGQRMMRGRLGDGQDVLGKQAGGRTT